MSAVATSFDNSYALAGLKTGELSSLWPDFPPAVIAPRVGPVPSPKAVGCVLEQVAQLDCGGPWADRKDRRR